MSNTLAQQRSAFALEQVKEFTGDRDKFAKLVSGLPAMILQNGFGQALAFLLAKVTDKNGKILSSDKHILAFDSVIRWLKERHILSNAERSQAMKDLSNMPQPDYLRAQDEAMAVLEWLKRYANAGLFSAL